MNHNLHRSLIDNNRTFLVSNFSNFFRFNLQVDDFKEPTLIERLTEAKLSLPSIVKPQVACGVAEAHNMVWFFPFYYEFMELKYYLIDF